MRVSMLFVAMRAFIKADRFSEKPMRESAVAPAPGQYLSAALPSVMSQRIHSVAPTTSAFVPPKKVYGIVQFNTLCDQCVCVCMCVRNSGETIPLFHYQLHLDPGNMML